MTYLTNIPTIIRHKTDDIYSVYYTINNVSGECIYKQIKPSRFQPQPIYILTNVDMSNIISYINEKSPLNDGDLINLQMEIRTHSLSRLNNHISIINS